MDPDGVPSEVATETAEPTVSARTTESQSRLPPSVRAVSRHRVQRERDRMMALDKNWKRSNLEAARTPNTRKRPTQNQQNF